MATVSGCTAPDAPIRRLHDPAYRRLRWFARARRLAGSYRLTTVDAGPLPYLVLATVECDDHLTRGTLTLSADGGYALAYTTALDCSSEGRR